MTSTHVPFVKWARLYICTDTKCLLTKYTKWDVSGIQKLMAAYNL